MKKITICLLLFTFASINFCSGETITIEAVKSQNITPYNTALKGARCYLASQRIAAQINEHSLEGTGGDWPVNIGEYVRASNPGIILTLGTQATKLAQEAVKDIPVVFTMVLSPARSNILVPGVSMDIPAEVKLKNLKMILPDVKRIGMIYSQESISEYEQIKQACTKLGIQLIGKQIKEKEFPDAFEAIYPQIDCFLMVADSKVYFSKSVEYLLSQGLKNKIPVVGLSASYTKAGALISFDCDYEDLGAQTAELALSILNKVAPPNASFVEPRKINYSLNLLVAERLGIGIAPEVIKEASEVFGR